MASSGIWLPRGGPYSRLPYSDVRNTLQAPWGWTAFFDPVRPFKTNSTVEFSSFIFKPAAVAAVTIRYVHQQHDIALPFKTKVAVEFSSFVFKPAAVAAVTIRYVHQQYDVAVPFKTKVAVEFSSSVPLPARSVWVPQQQADFAPFKTKVAAEFSSFVAPPSRVVWVPQQQTDTVRYKTNVSTEFASFVSPLVQAPWVQSYQTELVRPKTNVAVEFSSFVSPLTAVPTGWEYKETVAPRQKPVIAEFSSVVPFTSPPQAGISWGFGFIHPTLNAKLNIQVEFSPLPFLIAAVAPEEVQSTGDGPPWGLTGDEKRQLKKYYDELAALQEQYAEEHRANVQELLNDVRRAAGLTVDEIEEETGPVAALDLEEIRQRITELPRLPDRSLFSVNLRALQAKAAEDARIALEEDDEETLSILLLH